MLPLRAVYPESELSVRQKTLGDGQHRIGDITQIGGHRGIDGSAAFHTADIQHVIDEGQQVVRAGGNFFQSISHLWIGGLFHGDVREAHDGVHGSADIVGYIVEEDGLGLIGALGFLQSILQIFGQGLFLCQMPPGFLGIPVSRQNNHQSEQDDAGDHPQNIFQQEVHGGVDIDVILILIGAGKHIVFIQSIQTVVQ